MAYFAKGFVRTVVPHCLRQFMPTEFSWKNWKKCLYNLRYLSTHLEAESPYQTQYVPQKRLRQRATSVSSVEPDVAISKDCLMPLRYLKLLERKIPHYTHTRL